MRHTSTISVELIGADGSDELLADVSFRVTSGRYAGSDERQVEGLKVERLYRIEKRRIRSFTGQLADRFETITHELECPRWLDEMIESHADLSALLGEVADDSYGDAADEAYDRARDRRAEAE